MEISENLLKILGLNQMQGQVYVGALELGEATMQALARKSGVNRSTIYTFIDELKARGYILEAKKNKRRVYSAIHPEQLVEMQKSRVAELQGELFAAGAGQGTEAGNEVDGLIELEVPLKGFVGRQDLAVAEDVVE